MAKGIERVKEPPRLRPRARDAHKGSFGRVLIVGGSQGMIGAVALAANAALRGGAGLVTFAAPKPVQPFIATLCPCATSVPLACDEPGAICAYAVGQVLDVARSSDVLAVGPGMGTGQAQQGVIAALLEQDVPLVIDADGLNNLAAIDQWPRLRRDSLVLTPHPGEFSRLTGRSVQEIQADRGASAVTAARAWDESGSQETPLIVVLKGQGTVVTDGHRVYVNDTGNPGMATGGTGDVLTGVIAALIGQGMEPMDAACLGVRVHGRAGDLAAAKLGEVSMTAWDLLDALSEAVKEVC